MRKLWEQTGGTHHQTDGGEAGAAPSVQRLKQADRAGVSLAVPASHRLLIGLSHHCQAPSTARPWQRRFREIEMQHETIPTCHLVGITRQSQATLFFPISAPWNSTEPIKTQLACSPRSVPGSSQHFHCHLWSLSYSTLSLACVFACVCFTSYLIPTCCPSCVMGLSIFPNGQWVSLRSVSPTGTMPVTS